MLPAIYTVHRTCLYLVSIHQMAHPRLRLRTSNCSLLLIYLPRKDERLSVQCVRCRLVSEILRNCGDATEVELTRDGQWHVTKTEELDCPSPEPSCVPNVIDGEHTR